MTTELLAPAGCEDNFYAAVNFGANAVYIGLSDFSARKNAGNFTLERLPYILSYAHMFGVKVYVAVNTIIKNNELEKYFDIIKAAYICGADAFIVQDVFLGRKLKSVFPDICLHLSTQAGVNNLDGAKLAASYGFSRVILARETPISEIKKIAAFIETEVFIHGALCTCFSGHCYFSSFIGGQSGNRGRCRQPCRKLYKYIAGKCRDDYGYALSLADLSLYNKVNDLITAGVKSFKIEGRMRSFEYVCASCDFYSDILSGIFNGKKYENLLKTYNRGNGTEGVGFGQDDKLISDKIQNHCGVPIGVVSGTKGDVLYVQKMKKALVAGDCFKIISGGKETGNCVAIETSCGLVLKYKGKAVAGDILAITKDILLSEKYSGIKKLFPVAVKFFARKDESPTLSVNGIEFKGNFICEEALTAAVTKSEIKNNLRKIDVYPFDVTPSCDIDTDIFILKKNLNELRARAYSEYFYSFACKDVKKIKITHDNYDFLNDYDRHDLSDSLLTIISDNFEGLCLRGVRNLVFCPNDYNDVELFDKFFLFADKTNDGKTNGKIATFLYVPPFLTSADERIIEKVSVNFDGLYCEGASAIFLAKRLKKRIFGGVELNVTNNLSYYEVRQAGAEIVSLSKELSYAELEKMPKAGAVLAGGSIKIMSLEYCPFGKKCNICGCGDYFTLKDYDGRNFRVRRYKLSSCRFEIYNCLPLLADRKFADSIYDFTCLKPEEKKFYSALINGDSSESYRNNMKIATTCGNLRKGVE